MEILFNSLLLSFLLVIIHIFNIFYVSCVTVYFKQIETDSNKCIDIIYNINRYN